MNCNYDIKDYLISSQFYHELLLWCMHGQNFAKLSLRKKIGKILFGMIEMYE